MQRMPQHIEGSEFAPIWQQVEAIGQSQGKNPAEGPVSFRLSDSNLSLTDLQRLELVGGARDLQQQGNGVVVITLIYEDGDDSGSNKPIKQAAAKPSTVS